MLSTKPKKTRLGPSAPSPWKHRRHTDAVVLPDGEETHVTLLQLELVWSSAALPQQGSRERLLVPTWPHGMKCGVVRTEHNLGTSFRYMSLRALRFACVRFIFVV